MPTPTYDIDLLRPGTMEVQIVGSAVEGGRALSGLAGTINMSGGGLVAVRYSRIMLYSPAEHREWNRLSAYLRGGVNKVYVPILNDVAYPYPGDAYFNRPPGAGPFWIGAPFQGADESRYEWFTATLDGSFPLNSATLTVRVQDNRDDSLHRALNPLTLAGGEWFSIDHGGTRNHRAYQISEVDSVTGDPEDQTYTFGISPPLRLATAAFTALDFFRPLCTMGLPPDESMAWLPQAGWFGEHSVSLIEKF